MHPMKDQITHPGRIEKIGEFKVEVNILAQSACSSCHSKGMCGVAEMENKIVEVWKPQDFKYEIGDEVVVYMKKSLGNKAVFYGYLYPFLIMLASLIVLISITGNEGLSALVSLTLLVPYYFAIYKLKDRLSKTFEFKIK